MVRAFTVLLLGAFLMLPRVSGAGTPPTPLPSPGPPPPKSPQASLPAGKWRIEYANEVTEICDFQKSGAASVIEPVLISGGKAVVNGSSIVIVFEGGRVQRWTPIGKRFVVEHWFPGSQFPTANPGVLGIAESAQ